MDSDSFANASIASTGKRLSKNESDKKKTFAKQKENVWDDTLLIQAYDNSVKLANSELAKRIAKATNTSINKNINCSENESAALNTYNIGDYVRATYEDQIDYEAKIIALDSSNNSCTVKYIGYDNEQDVPLCELVPSWGKKTRRMQFAKSKHDKRGGNENKKERVGNSSMSQHNNLPPPPPMPPMLNELNEDSEHISAMLMSWYMSGYYTGLYQGQKLAKSKLKHKK